MPKLGRRRGAHLPSLGRWVRRWINTWVRDAWPVRRQTYGYLPSLGASPPFDRYQIILLGDRGTCVWTTCLRSLLGSVQVWSWTCASEWPQDYKSDTLPLDYKATLVLIQAVNFYQKFYGTCLNPTTGCIIMHAKNYKKSMFWAKNETTLTSSSDHLTSCTSRNSQSTALDSLRLSTLTPRLMNWNSRQIQKIALW